MVLVDAVAGAEPREILVRRVQPRPPGPATWSHHLDPETLAGLAEALYGEAPPVVLVGVGAGSLATGDRLSDAPERALPELVEVVLAVAGGGRRPPPHPRRYRLTEQTNEGAGQGALGGGRGGHVG